MGGLEIVGVNVGGVWELEVRVEMGGFFCLWGLRDDQ